MNLGAVVSNNEVSQAYSSVLQLYDELHDTSIISGRRQGKREMKKAKVADT